MNKNTIFLIILFVTSGIFYWNLVDDSETDLAGKVVRIVDGDTIEIENLQKIRLKGINTPEKGMLGSLESIDFLGSIILNKTIKIKSFGSDKYQRTLGFLFLNDKNINEEILKRGFASLYYYEKDEFYNKMKSAEEFARINEIGIWKKSPDLACVKIIEFKFKEPEKLVLENFCDRDLNVVIKDDATHIYKEILNANDVFELKTSHIWNDAGDTVYVSDEKGLLIFHRY